MLSLSCVVQFFRHTAAEHCVDVYVCATNPCKIGFKLYMQKKKNVFHVFWLSDGRSINLCYIHLITRDLLGTWLRPITCWLITTQEPTQINPPVISYHQSTQSYHIEQNTSLALTFRAHKRKTDIMYMVGRERVTKVYSFKMSFVTSNIYPNKDVAVFPLGWGDKMDHLIASLTGRELTSGSSSLLVRVDIWEAERRAGGRRGA